MFGNSGPGSTRNHCCATHFSPAQDHRSAIMLSVTSHFLALAMFARAMTDRCISYTCSLYTAGPDIYSPSTAQPAPFPWPRRTGHDACMESGLCLCCFQNLGSATLRFPSFSVGACGVASFLQRKDCGLSLAVLATWAQTGHPGHGKRTGQRCPDAPSPHEKEGLEREMQGQRQSTTKTAFAKAPATKPPPSCTTSSWHFGRQTLVRHHLEQLRALSDFLESVFWLVETTPEHESSNMLIHDFETCLDAWFPCK